MTEPPIKLTHRETADLQAASQRHGYKVEFEWRKGDRPGEGEAYLKQPVPQWALDLLNKWRGNDAQGPRTIVCPTCSAREGEWCYLAGRPRPYFIHDRRIFEYRNKT